MANATLLNEQIKGKGIHPLSLPKVDVAIFAEGTYPFLKGGVSSVIHQIIEEHPSQTFGIIHITWAKGAPLDYSYPQLPHIKWVHTIYLSEALVGSPSPWGKVKNNFVLNFTQKNVYQDLFQSIEKIARGDILEFKYFYQNYCNPLTRIFDINKFLGSVEFFNFVLEHFKQKQLPLVELYWLQKELAMLSMSLLDQIYPQADIYHSHTSGYAGMAAAIASLQHNKKFVLTEHSLYIRDVLGQLNDLYSYEKLKAKGPKSVTYGQIKKDIWSKWFKRIGELTYAQSSALTYLYDDIAREAQELGATAEKTRIIPNGINFARFQTARDMQNVRNLQRFGPIKHFWRIGLIARVVPVKGVLDLIESIGHLQKLMPNQFEVEIIGPKDEDPQYFEQCFKETQALGLDQIIRFRGPQNVAKFLEEIDIVVMSSLSEALPVAILEAMAASVPVVSTDVGSVRQIMIRPYCDEQGKVIAGAAGLICPKQNPMSLALALKEMMNDRELYEICRDNTTKRILHAFQLPAVMEKYTKLYTLS